MARIELKNVRKSFGGLEVIKGVDMRIEDGEFAVFVGPSGCGKSTLLRMIAGLETITSGSFVLDGREMNDVAPDRRGIAMVFQSYALYPHMTVAENMGFSLEVQGRPRADIRREVEAVAERLQLTPLLDRRPQELSGGQRQRVAIGRAIIKSPAVILFDEPLSNLDAGLRVQMRSELQTLHRTTRATIVYVTHDQVEAMTLADKIFVLKEGNVMQADHPIGLYDAPANAFVAQFIGSPRMNIFDALVERVDTGEATLRFGQGWRLALTDTADVAAGDRIRLGIRPEHLSLSDAGEVEASVIIAERLGMETYISFDAGGSDPAVARVAGDHVIEPGARVRLAIDRQSCRLFDASGRALYRRAAA
ncbi:ABC transporter ATP-binding protein [Rubellimicrobium rubrum]|uniref:ABC transporter ATP-binding protein n=1 Tax=Rubellimicrobium rubrum TaxID=2585369 RepID=A0A5C4N1K3_9RHOB|nr:ABC transporter ATP-binding protein [Rubellimicrobium rubrum]TNC51661.1 ABC transporter ATP-binding protein [Rubellimicrobium rubrum]